MKITDDAIEEFIDIWKRSYGVTLSREEGAKRARALLNFLQVILAEGQATPDHLAEPDILDNLA